VIAGSDATAAQPEPPKPCVDVLIPGMILTDETVDHGCIDLGGWHTIGATHPHL
jgi:hypothetical protein